jgi:malate dehydrogenase (oxaloacetate-decarboxylating)
MVERLFHHAFWRQQCSRVNYGTGGVVSPEATAPPAAYGRHVHPSASFSAAIRVRLANHPGAFARLASTIGEAGGLLGAIDLVRVERGTKIRDITVACVDAEHG